LESAAARICDGVVEAEIEHPKVFAGNRRLLLEGELGDRLTDGPVIVDDLSDAEPHA
jgi:hypothetical protein